MDRNERRLTWSTKLGYSSAELGLVAVEVLIEIYLLKFYHVVVGLPSALTGLALAIAIVWDAVSDPIMGELSDATRHRAGRRRPYILPGAVALALAFIAIYNPPDIDSNLFKFLYLLVSYLCVTTAMTVAGVPHIALGGELSFDRNERTEIFGYRRLFTTAGLLLGTILPALVLRFLGGEEDLGSIRSSRSLTSILLAAPIVLTAWITTRSTRGLDRPLDRSEPARLRSLLHLLRAQLAGLRNPVFLPLLLPFVIAGMGRAINASIALYYYEYRLGISESDTILYVLLPFFICILASVPVWVIVSKRFGKKWPAFSGTLGLGLLVCIAYPILPAGELTGPVFVAIFGGFLAGSIIIYESLVADVVDYDELKKGWNREGLYFGLWKMGVKLSRALGLALSGFLLGAIGFDESVVVQSEAVKRSLGFLFGPGVGFFLVVACVVFVFFPLTDARHRRVQALLRERRRGA
jgi:GPH family glycoside/pentoside/hexuronide:cation symporter